jgi:DNA primase
MQTVPRRLAQLAEDPWKDMSTVKQSITAAMWRSLGRKGHR